MRPDAVATVRTVATTVPSGAIGGGGGGGGAQPPPIDLQPASATPHPPRWKKRREDTGHHGASMPEVQGLGSPTLQQWTGTLSFEARQPAIYRPEPTPKKKQTTHCSACIEMAALHCLSVTPPTEGALHPRWSSSPHRWVSCVWMAQGHWLDMM
mmetsp:Transcript_65403/g.109564  ORF Transcript_65403/g.109564 Transcript_65403/m.109564 type:complete len:154 (+) Transcript_65403:106-567(+)